MSDSLWDDRVGKLRERIAATTPTPGGGAVAAVTAAFAVALLRMVCGISLKKLAAAERGSVEGLQARLRQSEEALARSADEDVQAFDAYVALRTSGSEAESEALLLRCADVPMSAAESVAEAQSLLPQIESICPSFARSDLATASYLLRASQASLLANVGINLDAMRGEAAKREMKARYDRLAQQTSGLP
jgi:methenyltetrahydrofolate cyclohydrolase